MTQLGDDISTFGEREKFYRDCTFLYGACTRIFPFSTALVLNLFRHEALFRKHQLFGFPLLTTEKHGSNFLAAKTSERPQEIRTFLTLWIWNLWVYLVNRVLQVLTLHGILWCLSKHLKAPQGAAAPRLKTPALHRASGSSTLPASGLFFFDGKEMQGTHRLLTLFCLASLCSAHGK